MTDQTKTPDDLDATVDDLLSEDRGADTTEPEYSEEDLSLLTETEREALTAPDEDAVGEAEATNETSDEGEGDGGETDADAAASDDSEDTSEATPDDHAGEDATTQARAAQDVLQDLNGQRAELDKKIEALDEQYDDGEMSLEDLRKERNALLGERSKIDGQIGVAETQAQQAGQSVDRAWVSACERFREAHPDFLGGDHFHNFDAMIREVTNSDLYAGMDFDRQLQEAARLYTMTEEGKSLSLDPVKPVTSEQEEKADAEPGPKSKDREPPITLADVPAETIDPNESQIEALASRYARIDDGLERESFLERLPEHLQEALLSRNV